MPEMERALDWNDEIENDGSSFVLLPPGDYDFTVTAFERERHPGSAKLPPCNKAVLTLEITSAQGTATLKHNLFLHSKTEGLLCAFFVSIGQRKHGEKLRMDWNRVVGSRGRCTLGVREWVGERTGEKMKSNEVTRFLEPAENAAPHFTEGDF